MVLLRDANSGSLLSLRYRIGTNHVACRAAFGEVFTFLPGDLGKRCEVHDRIDRHVSHPVDDTVRPACGMSALGPFRRVVIVESTIGGRCLYGIPRSICMRLEAVASRCLALHANKAVEVCGGLG